GHTDENLVVLEGHKSRDFESLLKVIFPRSPDAITGLSLTQIEWEGALKLSTMWEMEKIRQTAIERLSSMKIGPLEKIALAKAYRVPLWLSEGIEALVTDFDNYTIEDIAQVLGWEKAARFADAAARYRPSEIPNFIHKSRLTCYACGRVLESAQRIHCPCGTRHDGEFNFVVKPEPVIVGTKGGPWM
ncbi:hypothetical protein BKA70DRAFT_1052302, partial [Coprinopsis sp. MPI-PUGE-AT-0042]